MIKNKLACAGSAMAVILGSGVLFPAGAFANNEVLTSCDGVEICVVVSSAEQLADFFVADGAGFVTREGASTMIIGGDFTMDNDYYITGVDLSIYFGDHTVTANEYSFLFYDSIVNIYGGESDFTNAGGDYAPLYLRSGTKAKMHSGSIHGGDEAAVIVDEGANLR